MKKIILILITISSLQMIQAQNKCTEYKVRSEEYNQALVDIARVSVKESASALDIIVTNFVAGVSFTYYDNPAVLYRFSSPEGERYIGSVIIDSDTCEVKNKVYFIAFSVEKFKYN